MFSSKLSMWHVMPMFLSNLKRGINVSFKLKNVPFDVNVAVPESQWLKAMEAVLIRPIAIILRSANKTFCCQVEFGKLVAMIPTSASS